MEDAAAGGLREDGKWETIPSTPVTRKIRLPPHWTITPAVLVPGVGARFPESPCKNTLNIHNPTDTILESALYSLHVYSPCTGFSSVT